MLNKNIKTPFRLNPVRPKLIKTYKSRSKKISKKAFTSGFAKKSFLGSAYPQMSSPKARMMQSRFGVDIKGQQKSLTSTNKKEKRLNWDWVWLFSVLLMLGELCCLSKIRNSKPWYIF